MKTMNLPCKRDGCGGRANMHRLKRQGIRFHVLLVAAALGACGTPIPGQDPVLETAAIAERVVLGKRLFFDKNLSRNRTQACATCHDPNRAFSDGRGNGVGGAVSLGGDGRSLGDRNTPAVSYAFLSPKFHRDDSGRYIGGQFHDGRAATLVEQAGGPLLNPLEMGQPDRAAVIRRLRENPGYVASFQRLFGNSIFANTGRAYTALTESIAAFEKSDLFAPFDSRYDRYLRGEYQMTALEELGRKLFFSQLINCNSCHLLNSSPRYPREPFTNYQYHNIGVPTNVAARKKNGVAIDHKDRGLLENPAVTDVAQAGKFKVPTLRNVAVTGPYMHNGVFRELRTVLLFYSRYLVRNAANRRNPETGKPWAEAAIGATIDVNLLRQGQPLAANHINGLIAFLRTLTDRRYETLLAD